MSVKAMKWAYDLFSVLDIPPAERAVLHALCWFHQPKLDDCCPSQVTLAKLTGYRRQRVSEALGWLERSGLIQRGKVRKVGKFDSCTYQLFGSFNGRTVSGRGDKAKASTVSKKRDTAAVSGRGDTERGDYTKGGEVIVFPSQKATGTGGFE